MTNAAWGAVTTTVVALLILVGVMSVRAINDNHDLQDSYNRSLVQCVQIGRTPAECQLALGKQSK